ncbi:MAG: hypothetical protein IKF68_05885 [Erysipelotrichaceae bacterium]|nr:hypothetical protein [Erysipelotrichaceae bacterium]
MSTLFRPTNINGVYAAKIRDLSYFRFGENTVAVATDSEGSVGTRKKDQFQCPIPEACPLMIELLIKELVCQDVEPITVYVDFCYAEDEYNKEVVKQFKKTVKEAGYDPEMVFVTYGKYDREPTYTSMGITVLGIAKSKGNKVGSSNPGDLVYVIGAPKYRLEVPKYVHVSTIKKVLELDYVHEVLPGGSHGIKYEAMELAKTSGLTFVEGDNKYINDQDEESCGGSCCAVVSIDPDHKEVFEDLSIENEINFFGFLTGKKAEEDVSIKGSKTPYRIDPNGGISFADGYKLVSAVNSSYSIGLKSEDETHIEKLDEYGLKLVEDAIDKLNGIEPMLIINDLTFAKEPEGKKNIKIIREMLKDKYPEMYVEAQFTGSTEDNMDPQKTGFSIRIMGLEK